MHLAFLTSEFAGLGHPDGGLGNYLRRVTPWLAARGHQVEVFACDASLSPIEQDRHSTVEGVLVHHLAGAPVRLPSSVTAAVPENLQLGVFGAWRMAEALAEAHRREPFDAVHTTNCGFAGLFVDLPIAVILRFSSYEPLWRAGRGRAQSPGQGALEILERASLAAADRCYAPSAFLARYLKERLDLDVQVLRPPAYLEVARSAWDQDWCAGVTRDARPYLLCAGTLSRLKGTDLLAEALEKFWQACPQVHLHLAGRDGGGHPLWEKTREVAKDRLHYHGLQPHARVYPLMAGALGVLVPSRVENLPNTAIEALLVGTPVAGVAGTSLEELVDDARGGLLVPPDDPGALAEAMIRLARMDESEREKLGQAGKAFVECQLEPQAATATLEALVRETAAGPLPKRVRREAHLRMVCEDLQILFDHEWVAPAWKAERDLWKGNYDRLAGAFPVRQLLWLRRRLPGDPHPPTSAKQ